MAEEFAVAFGQRRGKADVAVVGAFSGGSEWRDGFPDGTLLCTRTGECCCLHVYDEENREFRIPRSIAQAGECRVDPPATRV